MKTLTKILLPATFAFICGGIGVTKTKAYQNKMEEIRQEQFQKDLADAKNYFYRDCKTAEDTAAVNQDLVYGAIIDYTHDLSADGVNTEAYMVKKYKSRHADQLKEKYDETTENIEQAVINGFDEMGKAIEKGTEEVGKLLEKPETWGALAATGLLTTIGASAHSLRRKEDETPTEQEQTTAIESEV